MNWNKNFRKRSFLLVLITILILLLLFFLPRNFFGTLLRRVDILGDILEKDSMGTPLAELRMDSLEGLFDSNGMPIEVMKPDYKDSIPSGMVAIEDFADSTGQHREMDKFYRALDESHDRQVRIAFFGDSYIEGDILTSALREYLQSAYGGKGVGWVEISCVSEKFRNTIKNTNEGWQKHYATQKTGYIGARASMAGSYFMPSPTGHLTLECQKHQYGSHLSSAEEISIYADMEPSLHISAVLNDSISKSFVSDGSIGMQRLTASGDISKLELTVTGSGTVYGVSFDGKTGICVDNYSLRGGRGLHLNDLSSSILSRTSTLRPYDLIVFEYGLNIASSTQTDYSDYIKDFTPVINMMKQYFPSSSILILGSGDRASSMGGGTMRGIKELINYQRKMASDNKIAFWDMRASIGGDGAISRLKSKKMAANDLTHINFKGGEFIAQKLFDVLQNGKMNYDRRRVR